MLNFFRSAPANYQNLDGIAFKASYQQSKHAQLLDVRTAGEFATGTLPGAINLDVTSGGLEAALPTLNKDTEYFIFCRSGNRSGMACELLGQQGFTAYNLAGGISAWPQ